MTNILPITLSAILIAVSYRLWRECKANNELRASGRASRPADQAPEGLGGTATIPDARELYAVATLTSTGRLGVTLMWALSRDEAEGNACRRARETGPDVWVTRATVANVTEYATKPLPARKNQPRGAGGRFVKKDKV